MTATHGYQPPTSDAARVLKVPDDGATAWLLLGAIVALIMKRITK